MGSGAAEREQQTGTSSLRVGRMLSTGSIRFLGGEEGDVAIARGNGEQRTGLTRVSGRKGPPAGPPMGVPSHITSLPTITLGSQPQHWQFRSSPADQVPVETAAEESRDDQARS